MPVTIRQELKSFFLILKLCCEAVAVIEGRMHVRHSFVTGEISAAYRITSDDKFDKVLRFENFACIRSFFGIRRNNMVWSDISYLKLHLM